MTTRVVHVRDNVPGAVYVGRGNGRARLPRSPFANPYVVGRHGTRQECIAAYRRYVVDSPVLWASLPVLAGKPLACWCRHDGQTRTADNACHADVLVELIEGRVV